MLPALVDTAAMEISATSNAAHRPDGQRRVGVDRNPPAGIIVIPSMPRKPSSNVAMNSAPCRCAAATIAASAKLNRTALRMRNSRSAAGKRSEQGRKSSSSSSSRISATSSAGRRPGRYALCGTRPPSASHHTRSTCSFSSPAPTATSDGCAISTPVPRGRRNAGSPAAGMWRCCVSTRGSGGERRAWPRAVRSGCSNARRGCGAARAICRFSMSRRWVTECRMEWEFGKRVIETVKWLTQPFWEAPRTCSTCMREVAACMTLFDTR